MRKEDIIKELEQHKDTVLSFPNREPWGDSSTGGIIKANHGADGLFDFMEKALDEKFMDGGAWLVLDHIMDQMESAAKS